MAWGRMRTWKVNILYGVFRQISELSVDVESKQKELQRLQQDKSGVEEQLSSLVRCSKSLFKQGATFTTHICSSVKLLN